jgi:hypothetical protein
MNLGHDDGPCAPCAVSALPPGMTAGRDRAKLTLPMRLCLAMLSLLASLAACGGGASSTGFSSGVGPASATPGSTGSTSSTADSSSTSAGEGDNSTGSSSTSSGSAADSTPIFDMPIPDGGPAVPEGCKGKIDFLFVVSASSTMASKQERLLASFPGFMQAIEDQLPEFDVHILSADDGYWNQMDCSLCKDDCDPGGSPPLCGAVLEFCDKEIGAGVTFPVGEDASNQRCELSSGARYIDSTESNRTAAFTCIAQVGTRGGSFTAERMVKALQDSDGCNQGFLRDDALLVVTIIQDNYDVDSLGTPESWKKALQDAKDGDDKGFALLVLTTDVDVDYLQLCHPNDYDPVKNPLRLLVESVDNGFIGSICTPSYEPFFAETIESIVELCEGFTPPPG